MNPVSPLLRRHGGLLLHAGRGFSGSRQGLDLDAGLLAEVRDPLLVFFFHLLILELCLDFLADGFDGFVPPASFVQDLDDVKAHGRGDDLADLVDPRWRPFKRAKI